ncbi:MAG: hypothetical protein IJZ18_01400, partial [Mailhella sp.]|nr:hypothetical protein [Mailhella sp.]
MPSDTANIQLDDTMHSQAPLLLFSDFVYERYLPFAQENKRSWKAEKGNLDRHVLPHLGAYRLSEITADILKMWADALEVTGLAYSSCVRIFWLAKYILNCSVRWGALANDAAFKAANLPPHPSRTPSLLKSQDVVRLIDILNTYRNRSAANDIHLMLLTGAGKSEILFARWQDVDFTRGILVTR